MENEKEIQAKKLPPSIQRLLKKMEEKDVKIVFGLKDQGHFETIGKERHEHIEAQGYDPIYNYHWWIRMGKKIGWEPLSAALAYFKILNEGNHE